MDNGTLQDETKDILPFGIPSYIGYKLMGEPMHKLYFRIQSELAL